MAKAEEKAQVRKHEWTPDELLAQAQKIMELKDRVMRDGIHFGVIPGCKKPSLWKAGAEKMCQAFRLEPRFETVGLDDPNRVMKWTRKDYNGREIAGSTTGYVEYESQCSLVHIPTGDAWARNVGGSCNNFESKYRTLNPYDVKNTVEKMAEKRAFVAAVLIGTGASDIFTQDIEDLAYLNGDGGGQQANTGGGNGGNGGTPDKGNGSSRGNGSGAAPGNGGGVRMATPKQVAFIQSQIEKQGITEKDFFADWAEDFSTWDTIPFALVNDVLVWIRE